MSERIDDGFGTSIEFSAEDSAGLKVWEKEVQPPGVSGGGANDTTTLRNTAWRTMAPKNLKTLTDASITVAYDPACYDQIVLMVNVNQQITITFPDSSTLVFWGFIDTFTPNRIIEGEQPTAECVIIPTNQNAAGTETALGRVAVAALVAEDVGRHRHASVSARYPSASRRPSSSIELGG